MITATELRSAPAAAAVDPRESMRRLPGFLQAPLTALTGKAFCGQRPWRLTPTHHLVAAAGSLSGGLLWSWSTLHRSGWWLAVLPLGWMVTLHGVRNLRMMIFHQCSHSNLYGDKKLDSLIGRILSTVLLVEQFSKYSRAHVTDHHSARHMTLHDPTVRALLITIGLRPGMTRRQLWRRLMHAVLSPVFHVRFLVARLVSHFGPSSWVGRAASTLFWAGLGLIATMTHSWKFFLLAWVVPLTLLFQISSTLRLSVKHTFPAPGGRRSGKEYFASLTYAVFLGEPVPPAQASRLQAIKVWSRWLGRMLFVHLPARYLVLTGDSTCHDFHHRHPKSREWANYIFARQRDVEEGHPGWPPYREVWGLTAAINNVFDSLANCDPAEFDLTGSSPAHLSLFGAFDD